MPQNQPLPLAALKFTADLSQLDFPNIPHTPLAVLGQPRAQNALEFGIAMKRPGYNIFVQGAPGMGKLAMIRQHIDAVARSSPTPATYVYVNNFDNNRRPLALQLPAGQGQHFAKHIETLLNDLLAIFPAVFESPSYQQKKTALEYSFDQAYKHTPAPKERRTLAEQIKQLDYQIISQALDPLFNQLENHYASIDDAIGYLSALKNRLYSTITASLMPDAPPQTHASKCNWLMAQYLPNVFIENQTTNGAPVIHEPQPSLQNLFGHIEYSSEQGVLTTDHHHICAGSLHKANGGYLILDASKMLSYPLVWDALKRALQTVHASTVIDRHRLSACNGLS